MHRNKTLTRRQFCKRATYGLVGSCLPIFDIACQLSYNNPLPFTGELKGEQVSQCHDLINVSLTGIEAETDANIYDVLIAGGGVSGLTTAWKLLKSGVDNFLIVDKEEVMAGLCRGEQENGLEYACGAHYVDFPEPEIKHLYELYSDIGILIGIDSNGWAIIDDRFLLRPHKHNTFAGGKWMPVDFPEQITTDADNLEFDRFHDLMEKWSYWRDKNGRKAVGLPFAELSIEPEVLALERITMKQYLENEGFESRMMHWYVNEWMIDEYGTPYDKIPAWCGLQFFRNIEFPDNHPEELRTISFANGLGYVTKRLSTLIPQKNQLNNTIVVRIENFNNLVKTTVFQPQTGKWKIFLSRYLVFAMPKHQVYRMIPELKAENRTEFSTLQYATWVTATIHLKHLPDYNGYKIAWDNGSVDTWTLGYVNNHHNENPPRSADLPHIISFYACYPYAVREQRAEILTADWETLARSFLVELQKMHPSIENLITKMDIWRWGHAMRQTTEGLLWGEQRQKMLQPFGNVFFSQVDVCASPVLEETTYRSVEVAEQILKLL